jgi:hypothetical protein
MPGIRYHNATAKFIKRTGKVQILGKILEKEKSPPVGGLSQMGE